MKRNKLIENISRICDVSSMDLEYIVNETSKAILNEIDYKEYVSNGQLHYSSTTNFDKLKRKWIKE